MAFERTLSVVPNASVLILDSPGGLVHSALSIATRVHALGLRTVILDKDECLSACALIFLAGAKKLARGELGVHQISASNGEGDLISGQLALADILEALNEYEVQPELIGLMLRTPPEDIYIFSTEEKRRFGFLGERQPLDSNPNLVPTQVDLSDPKTWRGKVITGQLVSSGNKWFAVLNADGTTTFQFSSGKRSIGQYSISGDSVCFKLEQNPVTCRYPVQGPTGIRWNDESGNYQSIILSVDDTKFAAVERNESDASSNLALILPGTCALIVASRPTISEARQYVRANISDRRYLKAYRGKNGWVAISIGTLEPDQVEPIMNDWKRSGRIPTDSYCSTGSNYVGIVKLGIK